MVGNKDIISKFRLLRSQIDYGIFYPVQYAAIAALTGPDDFIEEQRQEYGEKKPGTLRGPYAGSDGTYPTVREQCSCGRRFRTGMSPLLISA